MSAAASAPAPELSSTTAVNAVPPAPLVPIAPHQPAPATASAGQHGAVVMGIPTQPMAGGSSSGGVPSLKALSSKDKIVVQTHIKELVTNNLPGHLPGYNDGDYFAMRSMFVVISVIIEAATRVTHGLLQMINFNVAIGNLFEDGKVDSHQIGKPLTDQQLLAGSYDGFFVAGIVLTMLPTLYPKFYKQLLTLVENNLNRRFVTPTFYDVLTVYKDIYVNAMEETKVLQALRFALEMPMKLDSEVRSHVYEWFHRYNELYNLDRFDPINTCCALQIKMQIALEVNESVLGRETAIFLQGPLHQVYSLVKPDWDREKFNKEIVHKVAEIMHSRLTYISTYVPNVPATNLLLAAAAVGPSKPQPTTPTGGDATTTQTKKAKLPKKQCDLCGVVGHMAKDCLARSKESTYKCPLCTEVGHLPGKCSKRTAENWASFLKMRQQSKAWKAKNTDKKQQ